MKLHKFVLDNDHYLFVCSNHEQLIQRARHYFYKHPVSQRNAQVFHEACASAMADISANNGSVRTLDPTLQCGSSAASNECGNVCGRLAPATSTPRALTEPVGQLREHQEVHQGEPRLDTRGTGRTSVPQHLPDLPHTHTSTCLLYTSPSPRDRG